MASPHQMMSQVLLTLKPWLTDTRMVPVQILAIVQIRYVLPLHAVSRLRMSPSHSVIECRPKNRT